MFVQRSGHQFLAGPGLTRDHHGDHALAEPPNGAENILHGGGLAQHFGRCSHAFFGHFLALAFFNRAANQLDRLGQVKGLGQVVESAYLKGGHRTVEV